jgi:hypothetical protein
MKAVISDQQTNRRQQVWRSNASSDAIRTVRSSEYNGIELENFRKNGQDHPSSM